MLRSHSGGSKQEMEPGWFADDDATQPWHFAIVNSANDAFAQTDGYYQTLLLESQSYAQLSCNNIYCCNSRHPQSYDLARHLQPLSASVPQIV